MKVYLIIPISFLLLSACGRDLNTPPADSPPKKHTTPIKELINIDKQKEAIKKNLQQVEEEFDKAQKELNEHLSTLNKVVKDSYPLLKVEISLKEQKNQTFSEHYEENIENKVQAELAKKYAPHELALIQKPKPITLKDIPYKFKNLEEDLLNKTQELYLKVYNTFPYHEQGQIARVLALFTLEAMDQQIKSKEDLKANTAIEAQEIQTKLNQINLESPAKFVDLLSNQNSVILPHSFYEISQALMLNMNNSFFEESSLLHKETRRKWGQNIYEILSGKHFLTGRTLSDNERAVRILYSAYMTKKMGWQTLTALEKSDSKEPLTEETLEKALMTLTLVLIQIHSHAKENGFLTEEEGDDLKIIGYSSAYNMFITIVIKTPIKDIEREIIFLKKHFSENRHPQEEETLPEASTQ